MLRNMDDAQFHAVKSGHSNFSESTEEKKPLTAAEKQAQMARLQEKLKQKRLEREEEERKQQRLQEKSRRVQGKEIVAAKAK